MLLNLYPYVFTLFLINPLLSIDAENKIHLIFFNCLLIISIILHLLIEIDKSMCLNNLLVLMHLPPLCYLVPVYEKDCKKPRIDCKNVLKSVSKRNLIL